MLRKLYFSQSSWEKKGLAMSHGADWCESLYSCGIWVAQLTLNNVLQSLFPATPQHWDSSSEGP